MREIEISMAAVAVLVMAVSEAGYRLPEVIKTSTGEVTQAITEKGGKSGILAAAKAEGGFAAAVSAEMIRAATEMLIAARKGEVVIPVVLSEYQKEQALASGELGAGELEFLEEEFRLVMKQIIAANGW